MEHKHSQWKVATDSVVEYGHLSMKKLSCGAELWLDLWIKISLKLSWIVLFNTFEHKQTQIVIIQALSNINTTLDF